MPAVEHTRLPFDEAIAFFRGKLGNLIPTAKWDDVWKAQHDRAFMVAGAAKADLLNDLATAVSVAIEDGKDIEWFRKNFDAIVDRHGWAYRGERNWRTRVIYQTNLTTSYAAGRLAQLRDPELLAVKPFWTYRHNDSVLNPRPEHEAWDGLTLPADDAWFQTHYPPNGWGCQCYVVAVSREEAQRKGYRIEDPPPDEINTRTGEPKGIDKGWGYMPGDTVAGDLVATLRDKASTLPEPLGKALLADLPAPAAAPKPIDEVHEDAVNYVVENGRKHQSRSIEFGYIYAPDGTALVQKRGGKSHVSFTDDEVLRLLRNPGAVLVHNHPGGTSLSRPDFEFAARVRMREVWAITHHETRYRGAMLDADLFQRRYREIERTLVGVMRDRLRDGAVALDDANRWHQHILNSALAQVGAVNYERIGDAVPEWVEAVLADLLLRLL